MYKSSDLPESGSSSNLLLQFAFFAFQYGLQLFSWEQCMMYQVEGTVMCFISYGRFFRSWIWLLHLCFVAKLSSNVFVFLRLFLSFLGHLLNRFDPCASFRYDFLLLYKSPINEVVGCAGDIFQRFLSPRSSLPCLALPFSLPPSLSPVVPCLALPFKRSILKF